MKYSYARIATVFVLMLSLLLTACSDTPTTAPGATAAKYSLRYVNFKVYDPVYVGIDKGFFSKYGLQVEIIGDSLGGPTAIQAVSTGRAEAGLSSIPAIINAAASGIPVMGVTDIQSAVGDQPLEEYFVKDPAIKSVKDLKGKRVAVNLWKSSFHYTAIMALEKAGFTEKDVEFVLIPFERQAAALASGQVDMIGLMQPYTAFAKAEQGQQLIPLFTAFDVFGKKQFTVHFVNSIWAKYNSEAASAFANGIADSVAWIEANQDEAKPIIAKYTGVEAKYIPTYHFQPDARVVPEDAQFWLDYMLKRGDITASWLKPEDFVTNRYNQKAIR
ncbi:MAG: ABC transporter substrate-binding protein [Chloroflexi bacterium]|uniref:ABC transporter substrate-binding protein n=1 Tax=Candidatus Chlorohelix allophototropha TaxID=3003348 RepID=A0A8T7M537_9CHLR|nr:ABC transporter substrate-binding protein [Chloroflexota bacterium]WJW69090.1 ABC transporter substrate-binding protein [Chloroflexota bacterium L227-S17]